MSVYTVVVDDVEAVRAAHEACVYGRVRAYTLYPSWCGQR